VDIIQLECLSQSSSVLKVINGALTGRIWFTNGEVSDAETQDLKGERAFQNILSWKTGNFEILPPEPARNRTIFNSYQGLLLQSAQALDEARAGGNPQPLPQGSAPATESSLSWPVSTESSLF
jgi:hypothetical protein